MSSKDLRPSTSLAAASLMIGVLDHSNWYLAYAGMLFGFSAVVGYLWPKHVMVWTLILALGAPVVTVVAHLFFGYQPQIPWYQDTFRHFTGALLGLLPGLGAGATWRHIRKHLRARKQPTPA